MALVPDTGNESGGTFSFGTDGAYGHLNVNGTQWSYELNNEDKDVQALNGGESVTETFVIQLPDGTSTSVTIVINGTNDLPTVKAVALEEGGLSVDEAGQTNGTNPNAPTKTTGELQVGDVDSGDSIKFVTINGEKFAVGELVGQDINVSHGTVHIDSYEKGVITYTFTQTEAMSNDDGQGAKIDAGAVKFTVTVTDSHDAESAQTTVTIDIRDDAPELNVQNAVLTQSGDDVDAGERKKEAHDREKKHEEEDDKKVHDAKSDRDDVEKKHQEHSREDSEREDNAKKDLDKARKEKEDRGHEDDDRVTRAGKDLDDAKKAKGDHEHSDKDRSDKAKKDYDDAQKARDEHKHDDDDRVSKAKKDYDDAQKSRDDREREDDDKVSKAKKDYDDAKKSREHDDDDHESESEGRARKNYEDAQKSREDHKHEDDARVSKAKGDYDDAEKARSEHARSDDDRVEQARRDYESAEKDRGEHSRGDDDRIASAQKELDNAEHDRSSHQREDGDKVNQYQREYDDAREDRVSREKQDSDDLQRADTRLHEAEGERDHHHSADSHDVQQADTDYDHSHAFQTMTATGTLVNMGADSANSSITWATPEEALKSHGLAVTYDSGADGVLVAMAGDQKVFDLVANEDGTYKYTQYAQIDMAGSEDANSAKELNFQFKATDGDGDFVDGSLKVTLYKSDDVEVEHEHRHEMEGGEGSDVFKWSLGDHQDEGVKHFDVSRDGNGKGGDSLDLRDLLHGEHSKSEGGAWNLDQFLKFAHEDDKLTVLISRDGQFKGSSDDHVDQKIVLDGFHDKGDLAKAFELAHDCSDAELLKKLVDGGHLHTDA